MSEFALYQIHQELQGILSGAEHSENSENLFRSALVQNPITGEAVEIVPLLASVCDEVRMHEIMDTWKPHTVYHAAAYM